MDYKLPKGYVDLIEKKYNLKVLDNHYILVDKNFQRYNMMIDVQFNDKMLNYFGIGNSLSGFMWLRKRSEYFIIRR